MTVGARRGWSTPRAGDRWRGVRGWVAAGALVVLVGTLIVARPAWANFLGTTTNTANSFAAAASYPTYPTSVGSSAPWAYYRGEDSDSINATLTAADSSSNSHPGGYDGRTTGPATFWKFEENAGSSTADLSGAANSGTLANSPTWVAGTVGNALSFNGTTQYVNGARAAIRTDSSFSVAAWVYLTDNTAYHSAVSQDATNASAFRLEYNNVSHKWQFTLKTSDAAGATTDVAMDPAAPTLNAWVHLTGVYNSVGNTIKLYVNGVEVDSDTRTTVWNSTGVLASGRAKNGAGNSDFWKGMIDEVRVYPRALSATEALALYNKNNALPVTDWEFSEGAGATTADSGSNNLTGTIGGAPTWTAAGHTGNGMTFSGTAAAGRVTSAAVVNTSTSFTVAAWVYLTNNAAHRTIVTQDGTNVSGFYLQYESVQHRWAFVMFTADSTAALDAAYSLADPTLNQWYHLVGVYDAVAGEMKLYVNGALERTTTHTTSWNATGAFTVGRGLYNGNPVDYFRGTIDEVKVFSYSLSAAAVANLYNGVAFTEAEMSAGVIGALQGSQQGLQSTKAVVFTGAAGAYTLTTLTNPNPFTIECWFRTDSTTGGVLMSLGSLRVGLSSNRDRFLYLDSGNKISFGVNPAGTKKVLRSTSTYNDGSWHYVAATLGPAGQYLYIDGALIASDVTVTAAQAGYAGYWRWGGEDISGWTNAPSSNYFTGTLDEVAFYSTQLTAQDIAWHYYANH